MFSNTIIPLLFRALTLSLLISTFACRSTNYLSDIQEGTVTVNGQTNLTDDKTINDLVKPYKKILSVETEEIIGNCSVDLVRARPESTLGNWMADAIHHKAEKYLGESIDFAIQNYGGIRIPVIKKGPISRGKIYEVMPFDNKIIILYLNAMEVEQLIQHIANSNGWPVSYTIKVKQIAGMPLSIQINNEPLVKDKIYKVALPDYIANGGNRSFFLKDKKRKDLNILIRDALMEEVLEYSEKNQPINSKVEGRFIIER